MKKLLVLLFLTIVCQCSLRAQTPLIKGRVIDDSTGLGIPDVSVLLSGTSKGATTGPDGSFTVAFPADGRQHNLLVSYAGYGTLTLPVTGPVDGLIARLKKQARQLEDVVVIGYQTVRRRDLLASVSSVSARELKDIPLNSAEE